MIKVDQELFFIEVVLSISEKVSPLTTFDEDGLRDGFSRTSEHLPET